MTDLTHPQETTRTKTLLQGTSAAGRNRAIATIEAFERKLAAIETDADRNPHATYDEDAQVTQMSGGLIP
ncbi:hypothetical protein [Ruegeria sp. EL01]|jgi:hypothetical protein|uniref:hypothetical protein n=1 Tax=Ruegeria sp. EL01 TaxID=2107578 RepID=UPI000EA823E5|nr:hypothetical protein [Ruegeria sp. EL01]